MSIERIVARKCRYSEFDSFSSCLKVHRRFWHFGVSFWWVFYSIILKN